MSKKNKNNNSNTPTDKEMRSELRRISKARDFKGSLGKLVQYLGRFKYLLLLVMILSVVSTVFLIFGPRVLGDATTEIFEGYMGKVLGVSAGVNFDKIAQLLLTTLALYLISAVVDYINNFIASFVINRTTYTLRKDINRKMHKLPFSYYDNTTNGEVMSRISNDVDTISQSLGQNLVQVIKSITQIVGFIIMMFTISTTLTFVTLGSLLVSLIVVSIVVSFSQKYFKAQQEYLGHVNSQVEEVFSCHTIIKAFNHEEQAFKKFSKYNDTLYNSVWRANFFSGLIFPIMNFTDIIT